MKRRMCSFQNGQSWPKTPGQNSAQNALPLMLEKGRELAVLARERVVLAGRDDPFDLAELLFPRLVHVRDVGHRRVVVAGVVPVPVEELVHVVEAGEADRLRDDARVSRRDVRRVVRAEGRADGHDVPAGPRRDVREHLVAKVAVVVVVAPRAIGGRDRPVVPALGVHGVDADELEPSGVDLVGERSGEAEVLVLVEAAHRRREEKDGPPAVAEPEKLHRPPERGALPGSVLALHERSLTKSFALGFDRVR